MSKSAIATLKKAETIIAKAGVVVSLVEYLNDGKARVAFDGKKLWRNADKLAALIVDSAANAFQCENSTTFADNMRDNMAQCVDGYISSNLDDWSQVELEDCRSFFEVDQLARLAEMVERNMAFEKQLQNIAAQCADAAMADNVIFHDFTEDQDMNKARMKQNQTPTALPKGQLIDIVRASLRGTPASQEQIEAVGSLTETELRKLVASLLARGVRVTAYLTKTKGRGYSYGFITFGVNGQLPSGLYHAFAVTCMKQARNVATQYGAMTWNY